ncbi:FxSxx-COOH system tetratricopeptide repeat protein [Streptomyces sp. AD2-2]|nr:FxSxx-COOH system tetratricopeptide repeat protein [Streptomyces sp. AD2-2]
MPRRNFRFTGRDTVLEELRALFENGPPAGARVALRGISGVGKSQIAIEYAHRFANEYDVVWWISASFRATARQQFADLAEPLGLADSSALPERVRAVREALRTGRPHRRWLLVLDSADDLEQVYDLLPEAGGHVAVTTLTQGWAASGGVAEVQVERFTRAESISYARRHVERLTEDEADQLADAVEDFPLLLAQTTAWLDANRMSAAEYIGLLRRGDADEIGIQTLPDYPIGFQTSWALTLDSLEQDSPEATELLRLFAMFSPAPFPYASSSGPVPAISPRCWPSWPSTRPTGSARCVACRSQLPCGWTTFSPRTASAMWTAWRCTASTTASCAAPSPPANATNSRRSPAACWSRPIPARRPRSPTGLCTRSCCRICTRRAPWRAPRLRCAISSSTASSTSGCATRRAPDSPCANRCWPAGGSGSRRRTRRCWSSSTSTPTCCAGAAVTARRRPSAGPSSSNSPRSAPPTTSTCCAPRRASAAP